VPLLATPDAAASIDPHEQVVSPLSNVLSQRRTYHAAMNPDNVKDFNSFIAFVGWLASDRADEVQKERLTPSHPVGLGANRWENSTIEAFLEAAVACAIDNRNRSGHPPEPSWREFAGFLLGGKIYE
jgi:uncharacterized protein YifN (PemK superfamily)